MTSKEIGTSVRRSVYRLNRHRKKKRDIGQCGHRLALVILAGSRSTGAVYCYSVIGFTRRRTKMFARRIAALLLVLELCVMLSGCLDDHQLLAQVHEYFPGAVLYKFDKRVLWIQTEVDGITPRLGEQIFLRFLDEANNTVHHKSWGIVSFSSAMKQDGYIYLVLGFKNGIVVWDRRNVVGPNGSEKPSHWNLTWEQAPAWFIQHLGYCPEHNQILIVK